MPSLPPTLRLLPALALVTACVAPTATPTEPNPTEVTQPRTVKSAPPPVEFTAVVTSRKSSVVVSQVQARIERIGIHAGQVVKAGELVAKLDRTELQTKLDAAKANETAANAEAGGFGAQAAGLRQALVAETRLHKLGISSPMAVVNARAQLGQVSGQGGSAAGRAVAAKAAREQAEKDLARADIGAPIDGIITNVKAHEGEVAQVGSPIARVFDPSDLIIRFAVPKDQRAALRLGQRVELNVDGNKRPLWATITAIPSAQEPPLNFSVVEADIDDSKLAPGELTVAAVGRVRIADTRGVKL